MQRKYYNILVLLLLCQLSLAQVNKQNDIVWPTLSKSPWPMSLHDPQATGRTNIVGPQTANILWKVKKQSGVSSGPVISSSNKLYFGVDWNIFFYSMNADTSFNWEYNGHRNQFTTGGVIVDADENIYVGSGDQSFYCFNKDGSLKWKYKTAGEISAPLINVGLDSTLYFSSADSLLYALRKNGTLKWKLKIDNGFKYRAPALSPDGMTIYIGGRDNNLYALNLDGTVKWKYTCAKINTVPLIDSQGNIYVISVNVHVSSFLYSLNPDGSLRWSYSLGAPGDYSNVSSPCMDKAGNLFVINNLNILSFNFNGAVRWENQISPVPQGIFCPLACDYEGKIYFGCTGGTYYYCYTNDGNPLWSIPLSGNQVDNPPAFGSDGTLYIPVHKGTANYALIAVKDKSTGIELENKVPTEFNLEQNYPNPFNPTTNITFSLPQRSNVKLVVYDVLGKEVATLANGMHETGKYNVQFNGSSLASGMYFYTLTTMQGTISKKMMLVK